MRHVKIALACAWALAVLLAGAPGSAQQASPTNPQDSAAQAMAVLKRATELLAQAPHFSVTLDIGFDAVQDSGQKIEFGETRQIVLRRPDRLRVDATTRDGAKSTVLFDGKQHYRGAPAGKRLCHGIQAGLRGRGHGVFCP